MLARLEAEEHEAVPAGAGHALAHSAQGSEPPALVLEPIHQYLDVDGLASELALQDDARQREPVIATGNGGRIGSRSPRLGRSQAEVAVVDDFQGARVLPLRQPTQEVGLEPPGDAAAEEDPVPGTGLFPDRKS